MTVTYKYLHSTLEQMLRLIRHDTCHQSTCTSVKKIQLYYCISWLAQSCPILCDPMDCTLSGLSVHGILQEYWGGFPFPSPGDLPDPGIEPVFLVWAGEFSTTEPPGKLLPNMKKS